MAASKKTPKGRKVRCFETGALGTSLSFFKAPDGHYYINEAAYQKHVHKSETHRKLIDALSGYMGYIPGMVFPTCITQSLKELSFYGEDVILETLERNRDGVEYAMRTKRFSGDRQKALYLMAILKNHINDVYKEFKDIKLAQLKIEESSVPEIATESEMKEIGCTARGKDISSFLDEE